MFTSKTGRRVTLGAVLVLVLVLAVPVTAATIISLNYPPEAPFNCAWRTGSDPSVCGPG